MRTNDNKNDVVMLRLPSTLSAYSGGRSQIALRAATLEELFAALERDYPVIWQHLCNQQGRVRSHVRMFVNNELITGLDDLNIALKPGQEVIVLPAVEA